jgi:hypothetical protein
LVLSGKLLLGSNGKVTKDVFKILLAHKSKEWLEKTVDAFLIHSQVPAVGSVLYCNLAFAFEHTGIYVGEGKGVHLNGEGLVEKVASREFVARLEGSNPSVSIFCATDKNGQSIGNKVAAERALKMVGRHKRYHLAFDNCHCFTQYCLTGDNTNIGSFNMVQSLLRHKFGLAKWRAVNMS